MRCRSDAFVGFKTILDSGKTLSLIYLLVVRILQKQPTFYQTRPDEIYLFCENSVYRLPTHKLKGPITPSELISDCAELGITLDNVDGPIFLINSSVSLNSPPALVCEKYLPVFVVQAASSAATNQGVWMKGREADRYVMNPWIWSEIMSGYAPSRLSSECIEMESWIGALCSLCP